MNTIVTGGSGSIAWVAYMLELLFPLGAESACANVELQSLLPVCWLGRLVLSGLVLPSPLRLPGGDMELPGKPAVGGEVLVLRGHWLGEPGCRPLQLLILVDTSNLLPESGAVVLPAV
jgi:hypothetical protein